MALRTAVLRFRRVELGTLLFASLGLAVFFEGLPYFVSPASARRAMEQVARLEDGALRTIGLCLMVGGLALAWVSLH
jgi:uncharacterized protein YjeT (DUF2065 family)